MAVLIEIWTTETHQHSGLLKSLSPRWRSWVTKDSMNRRVFNLMWRVNRGNSSPRGWKHFTTQEEIQVNRKLWVILTCSKMPACLIEFVICDSLCPRRAAVLRSQTGTSNKLDHFKYQDLVEFVFRPETEVSGSGHGLLCCWTYQHSLDLQVSECESLLLFLTLSSLSALVLPHCFFHWSGARQREEGRKGKKSVSKLMSEPENNSGVSLFTWDVRGEDERVKWIRSERCAFVWTSTDTNLMQMWAAFKNTASNLTIIFYLAL